MKRNWDTIRRILLAVEAIPDIDSPISSNQIIDTDPQAAAYHIKLLIDAKLIVGSCQDYSGAGTHCYISRMTWAGHEFLDNIRSDTAWNRIKTTARERGIDLTFDATKQIAAKILLGLLA